jgi:nucleotide-binding universal stress UspA family protein
MLKSLLVGVDGTDDGAPALDLALRWGRKHGARVIGCVVVDEPGLRASEAALLPGVALAEPTTSLETEARRRAEQVLHAFAERCAGAGVPFVARLGAGEPHEQLANEAHRCDLVILGRRTHFAFGWRQAADATLDRVLQDCSRPIVAVPEVPPDIDNGPVVVAFDGSLRASRALFAYEASGLAAGRTSHVVSVDRQHDVAAAWAETAAAFLDAHGHRVQPHPFDGAFPPIEAILGAVGQLGAALLVIGAYGHSPLRELFLGSTTRNVLNRSPVPVFCTH